MQPLTETEITLFIEELKSNDKTLKLNAVNNLNKISDFLSNLRIHRELFPYLEFIIKKCFNSFEFYTILCDQIMKIR
jgi:hypothetical protein